MVANELFDAIPIRQFVKTRQGFCERMVGLDDTGALAFGLGPAGLDTSLLPIPEEARSAKARFSRSRPAGRRSCRPLPQNWCVTGAPR
jgi:SAM-dependent MidA family methyltransferase